MDGNPVEVHSRILWEGYLATACLPFQDFSVLPCHDNLVWDLSLQDGMTRKDDPNEYVVHDPLLEKGKEKFNKMQAKLKRREREWAGKSLT